MLVLLTRSYFGTLESTRLTTHYHNLIGPSLNYTAVETSDLPYLVAFKRLLIADSALFYPWPSEYNCCILLFLRCFIRDCVQLLLIADCTLFPPWSSVCNCRVLLTPFCFSVTIGVQLLLFADSALFYPWPSLYNCFSLTAQYLIPGHLYATAAFRWLRTVLSVTVVCTCGLILREVATLSVVDFSNQVKVYPIPCRYVMDLSNVTYLFSWTMFL